MNNRELVAPVAGERRVAIAAYGKEVYWREFVFPDGRRIDHLAIRGVGNPVLVFPVTEDREVIAVRQFRFAANCFLLEIPGGCPKERQSAEDTLKAELLEETGYEAGQILKIGGQTWFEPASSGTPYEPYLALGCRKVREPEPDETEIMRVELYPLEEWIGMAMRGKVVDNKTLAMTLLALPHLGFKVVRE